MQKYDKPSRWHMGLDEEIEGTILDGVPLSWPSTFQRVLVHLLILCLVCCLARRLLRHHPSVPSMLRISW